MRRQSMRSPRTDNSASEARLASSRPFCRRILSAPNYAPPVRRQPPRGPNPSSLGIGTSEGLTAPTRASRDIQTRKIEASEHTRDQKQHEPVQTDRPVSPRVCPLAPLTESLPCYAAS